MTGLAWSAVIHTFVCNIDLRTCCKNEDSQGGRRTKLQSLLGDNLNRNLFKSPWHYFYLPFWSYRFDTSFLLAATAVSTSESQSLQRSLNSSGDSLSNLQTDFFPTPNIAEVVSQPVWAWAAGNIMHSTADNDLHTSCTGIYRRPSLRAVIVPVWNQSSLVFTGVWHARKIMDQ